MGQVEVNCLVRRGMSVELNRVSVSGTAQSVDVSPFERLEKSASFVSAIICLFFSFLSNDWIGVV